MASYITFSLEEGDHVILELDNQLDVGQLSGQVVPAGRGHEVLVANAENSFNSAVSSVRNAADALFIQLKSLHNAPDEIEVSFGLKAVGEFGGSFVIAKAGLEANYAVKLTWKRSIES